MSTPVRPIIGAEVAQSQLQPEREPRSQADALADALADLPIAKELPPWDLLPSDRLLPRRRTMKR